jgi:HK97 family phage prohead protease
MSPTAVATVPVERSYDFTFTRDVGSDSTRGDGRTLSGYAAVFGVKTEINGWDGTFLESVQKGAFRKSIRERTPVMQFDHGRHPLIGSIPIGSISSLSEDDKGLAVEARLTDNWLIQPVRDAISEGSINGMSFRFEVLRDVWFDNAGKKLTPAEVEMLMWEPGDRGPLERELVEVKVHELGPVVFPAYAEAEVSVRSDQLARAILTDPDMTRDVRRQLSQEGKSESGDRAIAIAIAIDDDDDDSADGGSDGSASCCDDCQASCCDSQCCASQDCQGMCCAPAAMPAGGMKASTSKGKQRTDDMDGATARSVARALLFGRAHVVGRRAVEESDGVRSTLTAEPAPIEDHPGDTAPDGKPVDETPPAIQEDPRAELSRAEQAARNIRKTYCATNHVGRV